MQLWQLLRDQVCGEGHNASPDAAGHRLAQAIQQEEYEALRLAIGLRTLVLAAVTILLTVELRWPLALSLYCYLAVLAVSGWVQLWLRRPDRERRWMHWAFPLIDMTILVAGIVLPNPFDPYPLPPPMQLGFDTILYVVLFLVLSGLGQSARIVFFSTVAAIVAWTLGTLFILWQPGVHLGYSFDNLTTMDTAERIRYLLDPWSVRLGEFTPRLVLLAMIGLLMTVSVIRSRHLAVRQVEAERARRNLSRHFSPHIAEQIAQMDDTLGQVKQLDAVVMFADLVGFTRLSDHQPPAETVAMLRDVHGCLSRAVADSRGTLDKYLGDGIMASFGTPEPGPHDASAALQAARTMLRGIEALNIRREQHGQPPLQLAIGLHYGPLTLGNIGDESRVEYALIGETVNIAHRLEQMTRDLKAHICLSQGFMDKLTAETRNDPGILRDMVMLKAQAIRGLRDRMAIWVLPQADPVEAPHALPQQPTIH